MALYPCALVVDFDGTITLQDTGDILFARFQAGGWGDIDPYWEQGLLSGREALALYFARLPADREALTRCVQEEHRLRPGFTALVMWCREKGIPLTIASGGLDFYIQAVLEREGLQVPFYSATADFSGPRLGMRFTNGVRSCPDVGVCKCWLVERIKGQTERLVLVGDGLTDACAARRADLVFARKWLLDYCRRNNLPHLPFETFHEVHQALAEWVHMRGERSSPSPVAAAS
ncbi:MAG: MtnX-like HAD-IB family phosphatase [Dehalococcoidia bacterium]|nr:MtnX-like HAD-IB family phosphatase [Dehalococcoidia bacterium]MDW8119385.1 MtnX-like HAD-IB family phosphatase [Chloroflexota bacterium]